MTRRVSTGLAAVFGAVSIVLAIVGGSLLLSNRSADADVDRRNEALQAARQVATNMVSISYGTATRDVARVTSGATGTFKDQWASMSKQFVDAAAKAQSTSTGSVLSAGVTSMDNDSGEVIVSVTTMVTSPQVPNGRPGYFRFVFDVTKTDGHWLVSKLAIAQ
jgi:Mce-associated membrane protein